MVSWFGVIVLAIAGYVSWKLFFYKGPVPGPKKVTPPASTGGTASSSGPSSPKRVTNDKAAAGTGAAAKGTTQAQAPPVPPNPPDKTALISRLERTLSQAQSAAATGGPAPVRAPSTTIPPPTFAVPAPRPSTSPTPTLPTPQQAAAALAAASASAALAAASASASASSAASRPSTAPATAPAPPTKTPPRSPVPPPRPLHIQTYIPPGNNPAAPPSTSTSTSEHKFTPVYGTPHPQQTASAAAAPTNISRSITAPSTQQPSAQQPPLTRATTTPDLPPNNPILSHSASAAPSLGIPTSSSHVRVSSSIAPPVSDFVLELQAKGSKPETEEEKKKREANREQARLEIISSEEKYVQSIKILIDAYVMPLKEKVTKGKLERADHAALFSNIESIYALHQNLVTQLKAPSVNVADVIVQYADYLKMYTQYVSDYDACLATVNRLNDNSSFKKFLKETRASTNNLDIMSYLIMPVQRVPRYELLLRELMRFTRPSSPDFDKLVIAFDKIKHIALLINERKRQIENMSTILEYQNAISGLREPLFQPHRRLIKVGPMTLKSSGKNQTYKFILFNDQLMWTSDDMEWKGSVQLSDVVIAKSQALLNTIECYGKTGTPKRPQISLFLGVENSTILAEWLTAFDDCLTKLAEPVHHEKRLSLSSIAPSPSSHRSERSATQMSANIQQALKQVKAQSSPSQPRL